MSDNPSSHNQSASAPDDATQGKLGGKKSKSEPKPSDVSQVLAYIIEFLHRKLDQKDPQYMRYTVTRKVDLQALADDFYDYYSSVGWKVGSRPMKDWKAACNRWLRTAREITPVSSRQHTTNASGF